MSQNTKRVGDLFGRYSYCDCSVTVWGSGLDSSEGDALKPSATKVRVIYASVAGGPFLVPGAGRGILPPLRSSLDLMRLAS